MKVVVLLLTLSVALTACGPESSPEGRMTIKLNELKQEIDSLKTQNSQIKDSLGKVSEEIRLLKNSK
jgi:hypothetical protein